MAKTTFVSDMRIYDRERSWYCCSVLGNKRYRTLCLRGFTAGIVTLSANAGSMFKDFAEVVIGCFNKDSNFGSEVLKLYGCENKSAFIGIRFEFNGRDFIVTEENASIEELYEAWDFFAKMKHERYYDVRRNLFEIAHGQEYVKKQLKERARKRAVRAEILRLDETTEVEFKDEKAKKAWHKIMKEKSPYSKAIMEYARRWAKYMQKLIAEGKNVYEIAEQAALDSDFRWISDPMYALARDILFLCWKHSKELQTWYYSEIGLKEKEFSYFQR